VGRVLRRRVFASFLVLEAVVVRKSTGGPQPASVVIQAGDAGARVDDAFEVARWVRLGDVLAFTGALERDPDTPRKKLRINATCAHILEKWDAGAHGTLYYTKWEHPESDHVLPQLILQCPDSFVSRLIAYIHDVWHHSVRVVQPSATHLSTSSERHLLVYCKLSRTSTIHQGACIVSSAQVSNMRQSCWQPWLTTTVLSSTVLAARSA